jgi:hypothetical protein
MKVSMLIAIAMVLHVCNTTAQEVRKALPAEVNTTTRFCPARIVGSG